MKHFLFVLSVLCICGCSVQSYQKIYYTDYTRYINNGFVVSSLSDFAGHTYTALGDITVEYGEESTMVYTSISPKDNTTTQDMLDKLVGQAKNMGANGVIAVRITYHPQSGKQSYWLASGVAVKFDGVATCNSPFDEKITTSNKYDLEKALKMANERSIQLIAKSKKDGQTVYLDPDKEIYLFRSDFIKKYGLAIIQQLEVISEKRKEE